MKYLLVFLTAVQLWRQHVEADQRGRVPLGDETILLCEISGTSDRLSQITWQRTIKGKAPDDVFLTIQPRIGPKYSNGEDLRFQFIGNFDKKNGTLKFSNVTLKDEGSYTCIFSLFPSGKQSRTSQLVTLVPPNTNLMSYTPIEGNEEVPLATCTAAASKPKAEVKWIKDSLEGKVREELNETQHANGTTTIWSTLLGKPGREMNGQLVKCVISSETMKEEILETNIQVLYSPGEVTVTERSEDSFECATEANPNATFTWTRVGQSLPASVIVEGGLLQFPSRTSDLSGLYQCEAENTVGKTQSFVFVQFSSGSAVVPWVLFALLLVLNIAVLGYLCFSGKCSGWECFLWRKKHQQNNFCENSPFQVRTNSKNQTLTLILYRLLKVKCVSLENDCC
ncbi:Poliovirus receptor-like [Oryzias melastigma]|uniref:Poliovirus receptor-like n=1 Tax=Oryzias melastigma TaxID=30732 RepID=A0A834BTX3_ORYME|nr:Poliovirus receptor-like [Oryzias melastigma]